MFPVCFRFASGLFPVSSVFLGAKLGSGEAAGKQLGNVWETHGETVGKHLGNILGDFMAGKYVGNSWETFGKHSGNIFGILTLAVPARLPGKHLGNSLDVLGGF